MSSDLTKFEPFSNDVILVDGFWGCGKSIAASLIGSFSNVEKKKVEHVYEYLCIANAMGKVTDDAAIALLQTYSDLSQYNNLIGREVNLRWSDDSGLRNNPGSLKYLARLFSRDGDSIPAQINAKNIGLLVASHGVILASRILSEAYLDRLKLVLVVRHPAHMYQNVCNYFQTFRRSREFTLATNYDGTKVPWFANDWAKEFAQSTVGDQSLLAIARFQDSMIRVLESGKNTIRQPLVISFEEMVLATESVITEVEAFLGRKRTKNTNRVMRRQYLPRTNISQGKATSTYSFISSQGAKEEEIYDSIMSSIATNCSKPAIAEFNKAIATYNLRWPSPLADFARNL